jgi:hypothetical protein
MVLPSGHSINWLRDAMGRVSQVYVSAGPGLSGGPVNVAGSIVYNPYGHVASPAFGNGIIGTYGVNTDYQVNSIKVATSGGVALLNRTLSWSGETLTSIADAVNPLNNETLT